MFKKMLFSKNSVRLFIRSILMIQDRIFLLFCQSLENNTWNKNNAMKFLHKGNRESKYFSFLGQLSIFVVPRVL